MQKSDSETNWENTKENVQPLRTGRKASFWKAALQPSDEQSKLLIAERQKFEEEILAGESTCDPLDSWDKYLKWTQQNFLIGENKRTYESILRKFISKFLKIEKYKNDHRYINAWITLARISENPADIFSYMKTESLGLKCASYYIAWAEELENYGMYSKAASIYQIGQENKAEPIALLSKMQNAFEMRSARDTVEKMKKKALESPSSELDSTHLQATARPRTAFKTVAIKKHLPFSSTSTNTNCMSNICIFEDDDKSTKPLDKGGKWADIPDHSKGNKENSIQKPSKWSSVQQNSRYGSSSSNSSSFSIFEDNSVMAPIPQTPARKVSKNVERVLVESKTCSNMIEQPLEQFLSDCNEESNCKIIRRFPFEKIYSVMGEFQLEEIIAASRRKSKRNIEKESKG